MLFIIDQSWPDTKKKSSCLFSLEDSRRQWRISTFRKAAWYWQCSLADP